MFTPFQNANWYTFAMQRQPSIQADRRVIRHFYRARVKRAAVTTRCSRNDSYSCVATTSINARCSVATCALLYGEANKQCAALFIPSALLHCQVCPGRWVEGVGGLRGKQIESQTMAGRFRPCTGNNELSPLEHTGLVCTNCGLPFLPLRHIDRNDAPFQTTPQPGTEPACPPEIGRQVGRHHPVKLWPALTFAQI